MFERLIIDLCCCSLGLDFIFKDTPLQNLIQIFDASLSGHVSIQVQETAAFHMLVKYMTVRYEQEIRTSAKGHHACITSAATE